mmetsp:Transcript_7665/g.20047  ORF Transcript_7665/g.20047 Transcript_7665/m.20047 type:complete len:83 (+) Transcript_7665:1184-1432(+)
MGVNSVVASTTVSLFGIATSVAFSKISRLIAEGEAGEEEIEKIINDSAMKVNGRNEAPENTEAAEREEFLLREIEELGAGDD